MDAARSLGCRNYPDPLNPVPTRPGVPRALMTAVVPRVPLNRRVPYAGAADLNSADQGGIIDESLMRPGMPLLSGSGAKRDRSEPRRHSESQDQILEWQESPTKLGYAG